MSDTSITPSIEVTIGRQTRLYHAFITTAPAVLDAPSTLTLYAGPLKDVAGLAVDDHAFDACRYLLMAHPAAPSSERHRIDSEIRQMIRRNQQLRRTAARAFDGRFASVA